MNRKGILLGLAMPDGQTRITKGGDFLLYGGTKDLHEEMQDTAMRFQAELNKRGKTLNSICPREFAEILHEVTQ